MNLELLIARLPDGSSHSWTQEIRPSSFAPFVPICAYLWLKDFGKVVPVAGIEPATKGL